MEKHNKNIEEERYLYGKCKKDLEKYNPKPIRLYRIWTNMINRCTKDNKWNKNYIGRGINVCKEWQECFDEFYKWSIKNGYSDILTIDRINNNGNYEPSNCRWVDNKTQSNNKRNTKKYHVDGNEIGLNEVANELGIEKEKARRLLEKANEDVGIVKYNMKRKTSKYGANKTIYDGIKFDSQREANRYTELKLLEKAGRIENLQLQVIYELQPAFEFLGKKIRAINYVADFVYLDKRTNETVVEDVKGMKTPVYKLKKKMFEYLYKMEIKEI